MNDAPNAPATQDLMAALHNGDDNAVIAAIAAGADVNARDGLGRTMLCVAIAHERNTAVNILINRGADVNAPNTGNLFTALHYAVVRDIPAIIHLLLHKGADPNRQDIYGFTPLHAAATEGHAQSVRQLVEAGADVLKLNRLNCTAGELAAARARDPFCVNHATFASLSNYLSAEESRAAKGRPNEKAERDRQYVTAGLQQSLRHLPHARFRP